MIPTMNKRRTGCSSLCSMKILRKLSLKFRLLPNSTHQSVDPFWQDGACTMEKETKVGSIRIELQYEDRMVCTPINNIRGFITQ